MKRRTSEDLQTLKKQLHSILKEDHPQTVRGVFYQAVSRGYVQKDESEYKLVSRCLVQERLNSHIPFPWIADNTRAMRKPRSYKGLQAALDNVSEYYRRDIWRDQKDYVEIWCEKDAMSGVLWQETYYFDVPLMITRGFSSLTFIFEAALAITEIHKPTYIYYFGDYDPSGMVIGQSIEGQLKEFCEGSCQVNFRRMAVTPEQIDQYHLPTRPTKKSDTRAKNFEGESVELDAIPAKELRKIVAACIEQHIDQDALGRTVMIELMEKKTLENILSNLPVSAY